MSHKTLTVNLVLLLSFVISFSANITHVEAVVPDLSQQDARLSELSCVRPITYEQRVMCSQMEQRILSVTVRIEMQGQHAVGGQLLPLSNGGKSHATVLNGRFLVTHNHFRYSLTEEAAPNGEGYTGISLRTVAGTLILENAPLSAFNIVHEDPETLVLEFADGKGHGLFKSLGLPSSKAMEWGSVTWQPGMELAHIDWNGEIAHVDWVSVEKINTDNSTPHIEVNNFARKGASGGGVFWNGTHIGNVWARNLEMDHQTGTVIRQYTMLALNSEAMISLLPE